MKKRFTFIFLIAILLLSSIPIVSAQTYSGLNTFTDSIKFFFSTGDSKVTLALEIREKEVDSALENIGNGNTENAIKNLEKAKNKLKIVQEKISLATSEDVKTSVDEVTDKINKEENLPNEFEEYLLEEEITQLTAELTLKTFEYCKELAQEDFASMLKEEICNPETAAPGLEKELEELKDIQIKLFVQLMLEIRSCINDPGTCNCEANVDAEQKAKCEKMVALAIKCEYKEDVTACNELENMKPKQGDSFAESFVPDSLMNLFKEKSYMIEYNIEPSDGVPEECWDNNDKPECKQYDSLKETKEDWDEYGNFIGKRPKNRALTMRESIPQCFDENDNFLEEKCGKITMVENENGLINYLIEKEIDGILGEFENKSRQYAPGTYANGTIDINETKPTMEIREGWMMENNEWVKDPGYLKIKKEMNQIQNQIRDIVKTGMDIDIDNIDINKKDQDTTPKTPIPTDGSICCKKTMSGKTQYHWDFEEDCLNPATIKGEVVDNDVCIALGTAIDDEDDDVFNPGIPEGPGDGGDVPGTSGDSPGNTVVDGGDNVIDSEQNNIDEAENSVDQGTNVIDENEESSNSESNDLSEVDEGPGEPGEVDNS